MGLRSWLLVGNKEVVASRGSKCTIFIVAVIGGTLFSHFREGAVALLTTPLNLTTVLHTVISPHLTILYTVPHPHPSILPRLNLTSPQSYHPLPYHSILHTTQWKFGTVPNNFHSLQNDILYLNLQT